jgi:hypothetical protein
MKTTRRLVASIVQLQHDEEATHAEMYQAALFILSLYALEREEDTQKIIDDLLNILARIAIEKVREFNLKTPHENN